MDVTQLPFNRLVGLKKCASNQQGVFELSADSRYHNHLGTVHASALYALAEASSGQVLVEQSGLNPNEVIPILRRSDIKYRKPAEGVVYSKVKCCEDDWKAFKDTLERRSRALLSMKVEILNKDLVVAVGKFDWFVSKRD